MVNGFTNIFSFYTLIEFTYKYVEVNIIELMFGLSSISKDIKLNILEYLRSSFYPNLIKSEGDCLFFDEGFYGVQSDAWGYAKQVLLLDKRIKPALESVEQVKDYVMLLSIP